MVLRVLLQYYPVYVVAALFSLTPTACLYICVLVSVLCLIFPLVCEQVTTGGEIKGEQSGEFVPILALDCR